jgi:hypothetical protein
VHVARGAAGRLGRAGANNRISTFSTATPEPVADLSHQYANIRSMHTPPAPLPASTSSGSTDLAERITEQLAERHPVLADAPDVARMLARLRAADLLVARAIDDLIELQDTGLAEALTGVGPTNWMAIVARRTRTDARMLATAATMLRRLPTLRAAFQDGTLSWAQVRAVCLAAHRLPSHVDDAVDAALARTIDGLDDPDAVTHAISQVLRAVEAGADSPRNSVSPDEFLAMQPRLDGTGGRMFGELGPEAWAIADAALNAPTATESRRADDRTGSGTPADHVDGPGGHGDVDTVFGEQNDLDTSRHPVRAAGRRRLERLVAILDESLADAADPSGDAASQPPRADSTFDETDAPGAPAVRAATADGRVHERSRATRRRATPKVVLRAELDTLLDRGRTPAALLHHLLGGAVHVDHATARRMVDTRGAELRTVIMDHGRVVGVGRAARLAPGWLRDATLALHDVCTAPGCATAARACDTDHARPWHPHRPDARPGTTDIDQLAPLCRHDNRRKERDGWRVEQRPDGSREWRHPRSGLVTRTVPATWLPQAWDRVVEQAARPPP